MARDIGLTVVLDHLEQVAAPAAEDEEVAAMRIATQHLLNLKSQAGEALAHIRMARRQPHPNPARDRDHRKLSSPRANASTAAISTGPSTTIRRPHRSTISALGTEVAA